MIVSLENRAILITGAARGIGAAIAREAAAANPAALMLTDRNSAELGQVAKELGAQAIVADLADQTAPRQLVQATTKAFGRIDGLVNAAGLTDRAGFLDASDAVWERLFAVNVRAPFFLMQHAIEAMCGQGEGGTIVNILSMNAHCGEPELAVYASTKAALTALTKNAANTFLDKRIRVNGLNLGWIATESEHHLQSAVLGKGQDWQKQASAVLPLGRLMSVDEAARHAVFQLSEASSPMTGVCVDVEQKVVGA